MDVDRQAVADFARDVLGCQCPAEVFRILRVAADPDRVQIVIGDRLLIWLAPGGAPARVTQLAEAGVRARDAAGYNRFRLVLAEAGQATEAAFRAATAGDAKAHLHVVPESAWPVRLRARP